jgi:enamine deaminase RidA (YjgF/YER057c/UK114 family)
MRISEFYFVSYISVCVYTLAVLLAMPGGPALAQQSPNGVRTLAPAGAIKPTGTWNLGTRTSEFIYVAGMRGIEPATNTLAEGDEARVRQAFLNMKLIAESEGATLRDAVRIVVYVADMYRHRPLVNKIQEELWGNGPYPPRTIVELDRLNQDDIVEVEGTFYAPLRDPGVTNTAGRGQADELLSEYRQWVLRQFQQWRDNRPASPVQ